jgi:hypothetical protein
MGRFGVGHGSDALFPAAMVRVDRGDVALVGYRRWREDATAGDLGFWSLLAQI